MKIIWNTPKRVSGSVQKVNTCSESEQSFEQGSVHFLNTRAVVLAVHGFQRTVLVCLYSVPYPFAFGQIPKEQAAAVPGNDGYRAEDDFIQQVHPCHAVDDTCGSGVGFYEIGRVGLVKHQHREGGVFGERTDGFLHFINYFFNYFQYHIPTENRSMYQKLTNSIYNLKEVQMQILMKQAKEKLLFDDNRESLYRDF